MPKREKTPSPGPDEPTYLSIYNPFPPHSTLEDEVNVRECARWMACFVGQDNLWALFFKPSSPNVIIAEISNELSNQKMRQILGRHDWGEVFVSREDDEIVCSQVFLSTFRSRREVEKTGWRTVDITYDIFKGFNPAKAQKIKFPYPDTTYCEPPALVGEVNALRLFRFLPADIFPEAARAGSKPPVVETPKPVARVVPGSAAAAGLAPPAKKDLGGKGRKGKGNGSKPDPTVRPTAPLTRSVEATAKAKATHRQPAPVNAMMYQDDSDDDAAHYMAAHPGPNRPANWNAEFEDEETKKNKEKEQKEQKEKGKGKNVEELTENGGEGEDGEDGEDVEEMNRRLAGFRIKEQFDCPVHKKRCPMGICEEYKQFKRTQKRIEQKNKDTTGQWMRKW